MSASQDPGGVAERWIEDIDSCTTAMSVVGTLFVFVVVFRFNACYDRWWESRIFWGKSPGVYLVLFILLLCLYYLLFFRLLLNLLLLNVVCHLFSLDFLVDNTSSFLCQVISFQNAWNWV